MVESGGIPDTFDALTLVIFIRAWWVDTYCRELLRRFHGNGIDTAYRPAKKPSVLFDVQSNRDRIISVPVFRALFGGPSRSYNRSLVDRSVGTVSASGHKSCRNNFPTKSSNWGWRTRHYVAITAFRVARTKTDSFKLNHYADRSSVHCGSPIGEIRP